MILHIGNNISILKNNILAIIDYKAIEKSDINKALIQKLIEDGKFINKVDENIKSYIITVEDKKRSKKTLKLYTSNISSNTLLNRKML